MRPRVVALVVLAVVLGLAAALARRRHLDARRLADQRAAAVGAHALSAALDRCLFGDEPVDDRSLAARARRVALHRDTAPAWPGACATHALALVDAVRRAPAPPPPLARAADRAMAVTRALTDNALLAATKGFRDGTSDVDAFTWAPLVAALHAADRSLATAYGLGPARAPRVPAPRALASAAGDLVPASVAPGATVAGVSAAAGTLSVLFIEPGRERVFCRTRDRGVTVACRRLRGDVAPPYLVANDDAEALLLRADPGATIAPADSLDAPVFTVGAPLVRSLAARVSGGTLYAVADVAGAMTLARCPRGAPCARFPLGAAVTGDAAVLSSSAARWWLGVATSDATPALVARRLSPDAPPADPVTVTALTSGATLLASCHADGVAYAAASDGPRAHLVAFEADAPPRVLGTLTGVGVPAELVCDAAGATLVGASLVGSCERRGGCAEPVALDGQRRVARVGGELVVVSTTRDGGDGLRARHGAPGEITRARAWAVDDDAAHGGVSARDLWLFTAGDHLVLFATGATTAVLWSSDRGERWQASREPVDARPMRLGVVR
jgi:hypothetical protein